jgi:transposase
MIGVDLAKRVFQLHGTTVAGEVKFRKKLTRDQFQAFMAAQPAALVVFEVNQTGFTGDSLVPILRRE